MREFLHCYNIILSNSPLVTRPGCTRWCGHPCHNSPSLRCYKTVHNPLPGATVLFLILLVGFNCFGWCYFINPLLLLFPISYHVPLGVMITTQHGFLYFIYIFYMLSWLQQILHGPPRPFHLCFLPSDRLSLTDRLSHCMAVVMSVLSYIWYFLW